MGQCGLRDVVREAGCFARPILEGAAEAMDGNARTQIAQQHEQDHVGKRPPFLRAEEHELVELNLSHLVEDLHGARRERNAMFLAALHSLSGYDPEAPFEINLIPARTERFTAPCRGQYRELKSARANAHA